MARYEDVTNQNTGTKEWIHTIDGGDAKPATRHRWGYDFRVKDPDGIGIGAVITIDGEPLHYVTRYVVDVGTNTASTVTVTFLAQSVNRDDAS